MRLGAIAFFLAASAGACAATPGGPAPACLSDYRALEQTLRTQRARWDARKLTSYEFRYTHNCFCPAEARGPFTVTVVDGTVRSAVFLGEGGRNSLMPGDPVTGDALSRLPTVPKIFDQIAEAIAQHACSIEVRYDPAMGHPLDINIDYDLRLADEELRETVADLKALP
jgi:hypothetical protein